MAHRCDENEGTAPPPSTSSRSSSRSGAARPEAAAAQQQRTAQHAEKVVSTFIGISCYIMDYNSILKKMGTSGYLIIKCNGVYYVMYSGNDSYTAGMGVNLAKSIQILCHKFNGNIALAKEYVKQALDKITFLSHRKAYLLFNAEYEECEYYLRLYMNHSHTQHYEWPSPEEYVKYSIENGYKRLLNDDSVCLGIPFEELLCDKIVVGVKYPPSNDPAIINNRSDIDYIWELDVDQGRFGMGNAYSQTIFKYWSWRCLYHMTLKDFYVDAQLHYGALENWDENLHPLHSMDIQYKVILIQAQIRRFLAIHHALQPSHGWLYKHAKKEFEALQL